ncbi:hypothetical protein BDV95DRAFT_121583 [Massariosphaeria phaeospora]|uniref:Uncharacterized protein n=1 Tax=Massariosphaeria phaeospora TaxID=100035 RepID=A0A7C8I9S8_9PLEO|nr:hypothetical protein BDV95DRAFT_121583 [Massariosphaeria phaeospora]
MGCRLRILCLPYELRSGENLVFANAVKLRIFESQEKKLAQRLALAVRDKEDHRGLVSDRFSGSECCYHRTFI